MRRWRSRARGPEPVSCVQTTTFVRYAEGRKQITVLHRSTRAIFFIWPPRLSFARRAKLLVEGDDRDSQTPRDVEIARVVSREPGLQSELDDRDLIDPYPVDVERQTDLEGLENLIAQTRFPRPRVTRLNPGDCSVH